MGISSNKSAIKKMSKKLNDIFNDAIENCGSAFGEYADRVAYRASEMAPRLTGDLESSIISMEDSSDEEVFEYIVGVDSSSNASEYAEVVHERVTPGGDWRLGDISREKQESTNDVVGGLFLERAVLQEELNLDDAIRSAFK